MLDMNTERFVDIGADTMDAQARKEWHNRLAFKHAKHRAWVVFENNIDLRMMRHLLKSGFQHCWLVIWDGERWITLDPLSNHIEVMTYNEIMDGLDLPAWLADRYHAVIEFPLNRSGNKQLFVRWLSCVEVVKHYLGIKSFWICTPHQLYKHLLRHGGKDARTVRMEEGGAEARAPEHDAGGLFHGQGNPEGGEAGIAGQPAMDMARA